MWYGLSYLFARFIYEFPFVHDLIYGRPHSQHQGVNALNYYCVIFLFQNDVVR